MRNRLQSQHVFFTALEWPIRMWKSSLISVLLLRPSTRSLDNETTEHASSSISCASAWQIQCVGRLACPYYNPLQFEFNRPPFLPYYGCGRGHIKWLTLQRSTNLRPLLLISPQHLLPLRSVFAGASFSPPSSLLISLVTTCHPSPPWRGSVIYKGAGGSGSVLNSKGSRQTCGTQPFSRSTHFICRTLANADSHIEAVRWVRGCRVIAALSARGWGLAASWRGRPAAWGTMGRSCWWWDQSNTWKDDVSTRQDALFTSKL